MFFSHKKKPIAMIVLDGWGVAPSWGGNAISQAQTKTFDKLWQKFPSTTLLASGEAVGLPTNAPGNSEAGHLNIGAGHVIRQDQTLVDAEIENGNFFKNPVILKAIAHAKELNSSIHVMGLLSKTGTHSHIKHLYTLLELIKSNNFNRVFIHLFSDGRDSSPLSGIEMITEVETRLKQIGIGQIVSITGRFYAMDRDNRWGRLARAYNLMVKGEGEFFESARTAFTSSYAQGVTDEFIEPRMIVNKLQSKALISDNDSIILFNFRSDRIKELTRAFLDPNLSQFPDRKLLKNLFFASFGVYDNEPLSQQVFFPEPVLFPISKVWANQGLHQFHIAETEKYPHVTYFINGGIEKPFAGEDRILIPSPRNIKTYDYAPRMSADKVTETLVGAIKSNRYDCFIVNYANPDMVGHTGNLSATVQAIECVDENLGKVLKQIIDLDGYAFVFADHGNAEQMVNPSTGDPDTEHTTNPVPFVIVSANENKSSVKLKSDGILASIAPTVLEIMQTKIPETMRNHPLIIKESLIPNGTS